MTNQEKDQVELETVERDQWIKRVEALERLERNDDFKMLILEGYLRDKVLESVSLLGIPEIKKQGHRPDVMEDLIACSNLQYYLAMVKNLGSVAKEDRDEGEAN